MFDPQQPVRVRHVDARRPDDTTLIARDGLALQLRVGAERGLAKRLEHWFEAVLAALDPRRFDRAWVGMTTNETSSLDARRLGGCRRALREVDEKPGYFWIGGNDDPDNPGFVIRANLRPGGPLELSVRLDAAWVCERGWAQLGADIRGWVGELPLESGWAAPSLYRGSNDDIGVHLRSFRDAIAPRLWASPGWIPHDDRGVGPPAGKLDHVGWMTFIGAPVLESLAERLEVALPGVERHPMTGGSLVLTASSPEGDDAIASIRTIARAVEPCLALDARQPVNEWLQGHDNQVNARCKAWLRRHLDPAAYEKRGRRELAKSPA